MSSSRYFKRLGTKKDIQLNLTRYNSGYGFKTWPKDYAGKQKRSVNFGAGYISWRHDRKH